MKTRIALALVLVALVAVPLAGAAGPNGRYQDPAYGFEVTVPPLGSSQGAVAVQRLAVAAPARDGFAANCNVQVQFTAGDIDSFVDLSLRQFKSAGLRVLRHEAVKVSALPAAKFEYSGELGGHDLHILALAVSGGDRVWLLTCTALSATFGEYKDAFTQALDSFTVTAPETPPRRP